MDLLLWKKIKYKINNVCNVNKVVVEIVEMDDEKLYRVSQN
jgi:hypothetical protein